MQAIDYVKEEEHRTVTAGVNDLDGALRALERDGYVVLHDCLGLEHLDKLGPAFDELMAAKVVRANLGAATPEDGRTSKNDGVLIDFRPQGGNHDLNRWNMHLPSRVPFFDDRLLAIPLVVDLVEAALGSDAILAIVASDTPFPGSGFQTIHQDDVLPRLTLNVPLVDVGEDNGPIELWPGTHVRGAGASKPWTATTRWSAEEIRAHVRDNAPVRVHLSRGSVLVRDHRLLHRGTPNRSSVHRPMLSLLFFPRPSDVPPRDLLDDVARLALGRREGARAREPFDWSVLDRANALGRHVEYQGGSDRDYRRRIPMAVFERLSPRARHLLRLASLERGDAPCEDIPRTPAAAQRLAEIARRHDDAEAVVRPASKSSLEEEAKNVTLGERVLSQLSALCQVAGFGDHTRRVLSQMELLGASWANRPLCEAPRWSGFSDDCTPYELSVVLGASRPEVRVGFEVQSSDPSPGAYWKASLALNDVLERQFGTDLDAFRRLADLFRPTDANAYFALWHGVCFWPNEKPAFKIYLNPYASGRGRCTEVLAAALDRLGFPKAIPELVARMHPGLDQFLGLGIDLSAELGMRAKVYIRTRDCARQHLVDLMSLARDARPDEAAEFASVLTGREAHYDRRPLQVCYAFVDPSEAGYRPDRATLLVPPITYADSEATIRERVVRALGDSTAWVDQYRRYAEAFAPGPPERDRGAHGYVSLQWERSQPRVTAYFYGRAFRDRFGELDPSRPWPSPHSAYRESV